MLLREKLLLDNGAAIIDTSCLRRMSERVLLLLFAGSACQVSEWKGRSFANVQRR